MEDTATVGREGGREGGREEGTEEEGGSLDIHTYHLSGGEGSQEGLHHLGGRGRGWGQTWTTVSVSQAQEAQYRTPFPAEQMERGRSVPLHSLHTPIPTYHHTPHLHAISPSLPPSLPSHPSD